MGEMLAALLLLFVASAAGQIQTVDDSECAFPFTLNGTVYYSCIQNIPYVTDFNNQYGCFLINRTGAICTGQPSGYYQSPTTNLNLTLNGIDYKTTSVGGWTVIMQKGNCSTYNWTQNWATYRNGFGTPGQDFWLGLEPIYQLTQGGNFRLRIEMLRMTAWLWYSVEYWQFTLANEAGKYAINVNGFVGGDTLTDGFNYNPTNPKNWQPIAMNGMKFSTYDSDNDNSTGTCSTSGANGVGWWYNGCFYANIMGPAGGSWNINVWPYNSSNSVFRYPIAASRMMIQAQPIIGKRK